MSTSKPDWQWAMLSKPSISIRKGKAFGFDKPFEDTSTLVLTSATGYYIDVRFNLKGDPTSGPSFWAFAGTSETALVDGIECTAHAKWEHLIDSKEIDGVDEGDMFMLQNGDCMEVGVGKNGLYKELWNSPYPNLAPSVVARTAGQWDGIVIRIGDHCQGILQDKASGKIYVERWVRGKTWLKDEKSNTTGEQEDVVLPCMWAATAERVVGDTTEAHGKKWEIIEAA